MEELLRAGAALIGLSYLAYQDVRYREVSGEYVWYIMGGLGVLFDVYDLALGRVSPIDIGIGVGVAFAMGLALYYVFRFGGADAIAIWVLGLMFPYGYFGLRRGIETPLPILTIFNNAILLSLASPLANLIHNLARVIEGKPLFSSYEGGLGKKALLLLVGRRVPYEEAVKRRFMLSMESIDDGVRTVHLFGNPSVDPLEVDFDDPEARLPGIHGGELWVTVPMPFLLYLLMGLVAMLLYGDMMVTAIVSLMRNMT